MNQDEFAKIKAQVEALAFSGAIDEAYRFLTEKLANLHSAESAALYVSKGGTDLTGRNDIFLLRSQYGDPQLPTSVRKSEIDSLQHDWTLNAFPRLSANLDPIVYVIFNTSAAAIHQELQKQIGRSIDSLFKLEIYQELLALLSASHDTASVLKAILSASTALTGADGGDIALWCNQVNDLIIVQQNGYKSKENPPFVLPWRDPPGMIRTLWNDLLRETLVCPNVNQAKHIYQAVNAETKSAITVRWNLGGRRLGILNLESKQHSTFDAESFFSLKALLRFCSEQIERLERSHIFGRFGVAFPTEAVSFENVLHNILGYACITFGFSKGIIYHVDTTPNSDHALKTSKLRIKEVYGIGQLPISPSEFWYDLDLQEPSFAVEAWKGRPVSTFDPALNSLVTSRGKALFNINTPLVGIPLPARASPLNVETSAVIVMWDHAIEPAIGSNSESLYRDILTNTGPFAVLAGNFLKQWQCQNGELLRYYSLLDSVPGAVFCKDKNFCFTFANHLFWKDLGRSINQIIGGGDEIFYPDHSHQKYRIDDSNVFATGNRFTGNEVNIKFPGIAGEQKRIVYVVKEPLRDHAGRTIGIQGLYLDALPQIDDDLVEGVYQSSPDGYIFRANKALVEMLGYSSEEEVRKLYIPDDIYVQRKAREEFKAVIEREGIVRNLTSEFKRKSKAGVPELIVVSENSRAMRDAHNNVIYYQGTIHDETALNRLRECFSSGVLGMALQHEIWKPLSRIQHIYAVIPRLGEPTPPRFLEALDKIDTHARKMRDLLRCLSGALHTSASGVCKPKAIIKAVLKDLTSDKYDIYPEFTNEFDDREIACSEGVAEIIFANLLRNAVSHCTKREQMTQIKVTLSARMKNSKLCITVENDGQFPSKIIEGFGKAEYPLAWSYLWSVHSSFSTSQQIRPGGCGLPLVKLLVSRFPGGGVEVGNPTAEKARISVMFNINNKER